MSKRAPQFKRRPQDAYDTPPEAVLPLLAHLPDRLSYWEPCAGLGSLVVALDDYTHYLVASDKKPRAGWIREADAFDPSFSSQATFDVDYIITNPPWTRSILHPMIEHFSDMRPTWLLFDADWMHTKQAIPYLPRLRKIVSVGRVKWIADSPHTGKDNACWYLFDKPSGKPPEFWGRT